MSTTPEVSDGAQTSGPRIRLGTEFGQVMGALVADISGALGAVLTDHRDDAVDYAHWPGAISEFDIEVTAAQVGDAARRMYAQSIALGLGRPMLVVETEGGVLVLGMPGTSYMLTLVLDRSANLARAMGHFRADLRRIGRLLP